MPVWTVPQPVPPPPRPSPARVERGWWRWAASGPAVIETDARETFRLRLGGRTVLERPGASDEPAIDDVAYVRGLLATVEERRVVVRRIARDGRVGRARTVGRAWTRGRVVAKVAPDGRAVVAWATSDAGEEIDRPLRVYAAVRDPGATRFGPPQWLDTAAVPGSSTGHLRMALNDRAALLAWSVRGRGHRRPLRYARAGARGGFGAPVRIAGQSHLAAVSVRRDGVGLIAWAQAYGVRARLAGGRPVQLSHSDRAHALRASFSRDGRPRVSWSTRRPPVRRLSSTG